MRGPLLVGAALIVTAVVALGAAIATGLGRSSVYVGGGQAAPVALQPSASATPPPSQFAVYVAPSPPAATPAPPATAPPPPPAPPPKDSDDEH